MKTLLEFQIAMTKHHIGTQLAKLYGTHAQALAKLSFSPPISHTYNPLDYAWPAFADYLHCYGNGQKDIILLGMNPGPFGMAQTGIPFGNVQDVKNWLQIETAIGKPTLIHPKRPIDGFATTRNEVSGARLWGWAQTRFGSPERFFARFFVLNYCALAFMETSGRNVTPDKLRPPERQPLFAECDRVLSKAVGLLQPEWVIGIGAFAAQRAELALAAIDVRIGQVLHPSPANPAANRGWSAAAESQLENLGIAL